MSTLILLSAIARFSEIWLQPCSRGRMRRNGVYCLALVLLSSAPAVTLACTNIAATSITTNTTWGPTGSPPDSCYTIANTITISGSATLSVQPGTVLKFATGTSLIVGGGTAGSLSATGTGGSPVVFTSGSGAIGGWGGIDFTDASDAGGASSSLLNCVIQRGGSNGFQIRVTNSSGVSLSGCVVRDHSGAGLVLNGAAVTASQCSFQDWGTYPIAGHVDEVGVVLGGSTLVPNLSGARNGIELLGGSVTQSAVLPTPPAGFCYITDGASFNIGAPGGPVVTVQPGTVIKMAGGQWQTAGNGSPGGLSATNTVFTSAKDDTLGDTNGDGASVAAPGDWNAITFEAATLTPQSILDGCTVRYAGGASYGCGVRLNGSDPTVQHCLITLNLLNGIRAFIETTTAGNVTGNVLRSNTQEQVYAEVHAMGNLVNGNTIVASGSGKYNGYLLRGGSVTQSSVLPTPQAGFCYITDGASFNIGAPGAPVVTVQPGTVIKMAGGQWQTAGNGSPGGLSAINTVFTSAKDDTLGDTNGDGVSVAAPGDWNAITFEASTIVPQSVLSGCTVRYAGGGGYGCGVRLDGSDPTVQNCLITQNLLNGIRAFIETTTAGNVTGNVLRSNTQEQVYAEVHAMGNLVNGNTIVASGSGKYNAYLLKGGSVTQSSILPTPQAGFCYITDGASFNIGSPGGPVVTVQPGTMIKMAGGQWLTGAGGSPGGLSATNAVFTSAKDDTLGDSNGDGVSVASPGDWSAITFEGATLAAQSTLDGCTVRYAGGAGYGCGVRLNASDPTIRHCLITLNLMNGIRAFGDATTAANVAGNVLRSNTQYQVYAEVHAMGNLVTNNTTIASGTGKYNGYLLRGASVTQSSVLPVTPAGFCYITDGQNLDFGSPADPMLFLQPGVLVKMSAGSRLLFGAGGSHAGIIAKGVTVTSALDDTLGDTNADGLSTGAPGQWNGILFEDAADDDQSVLSCSTIRFGGSTLGGFDSEVRITNSSPSFAFVVFDRGLTKAVRIIGTNAHPSFYGCSFIGNDIGIQAEGGAQASIHTCAFLSDHSAAVVNTSPASTLNAITSWWGSASGPHNTSTNPSGTGETVSDFVTYSPWLTSAPTPDCNLNVGVEDVLAFGDASGDAVRLYWSDASIANELVAIERVVAWGAWTHLADARVSVTGELRFADAQIAPGTHYGYRIVAPGLANDPRLEIWVDTPRGELFGVHPVGNPSVGQVAAYVAFANGERAQLDLVDVRGRIVDTQRWDSPTPGTMRTEIGVAHGLASGVYFLRLRQSGKTALARVCVVR
jgi:hypothetical protein